MGGNKVTTYDDLMDRDEQAIAAHCEEQQRRAQTGRRYENYPEAHQQPRQNVAA